MIDLKNFWKRRKKLVLGLTAGVTAAAVGCGFWYQAGHSNADPVYVYPFQYVGMTEYWGDSQESHGPVTTDKIQTVFLSETQTVTAIHVQEGDQVSKGDLLLEFDTTMSDLQLERKRLGVETLKLQVEDAKDELRRINGMKPMVIRPPAEPDTDEGSPIPDDRLYPRQSADGDINAIINGVVYDGKTADRALIYWLFDNTPINDSIFAEAEVHATFIQDKYKPQEPDPGEGGENPGEGGETPGEGGETPGEGGETPGEGGETPAEGGETPGEGGETPAEGGETPGEGGGTPAEAGETPGEGEPAPTGEEDAGPVPSNASASEPLGLEDGDSFYVVIKVTQNNMTESSKKVWQCMKVRKDGGSYSFTFADTLIPDYSMPMLDDPEDDSAEDDFGSGYTAEQIAQMRSDQKKKIADLEFQVKMAEAEYKIALKEVSDGKVYAEIDGKVMSLLTEEEAKMTHQPIIKVSGGGGFYVEGFISELEKENMKIGQEVTVNDWNTGMTYTGHVSSIGEFPTREGYFSGNGNPNASFYPFMVFVDETADLQAGSYVSVQYSNAESKNGIYLENPFIRTEKGRSYVLVLGQDGRLEQRWVTTGKSLWGSYTEILSNLTAEDLVAFPYGKNVKPGVPAQEGDMSNLYS